MRGQRTVQGSIHVGPGCYRGWALPVGKDATSPVLPVKGPEAEVVAGRSVPVGRRAAAARTVRGLRAGAGRTPGRWSPVQGGGHLSPSLSLPGLGRAGRGAAPEADGAARAAAAVAPLPQVGSGRSQSSPPRARPRCRPSPGVSAGVGDCRVPRAPGCPQERRWELRWPTARRRGLTLCTPATAGGPSLSDSPPLSENRTGVKVARNAANMSKRNKKQKQMQDYVSRWMQLGNAKEKRRALIEVPAYGWRVACSDFLHWCP